MSEDKLKKETSEKEVLMQRAKKLGMEVSPNIGLETLRNRINEKIEKDMSPEEKDLQLHTQKRNEALKLIRVNVNPIEPLKTHLEGEILTVSNALVGTIKRYIPFGQDWHIENIVYQALKEKKYQQFKDTKNRDGSTTRKSREATAYNIAILPPLTEEELEEMRKIQLSRKVEEE